MPTVSSIFNHVLAVTAIQNAHKSDPNHFVIFQRHRTCPTPANKLPPAEVNQSQVSHLKTGLSGQLNLLCWVDTLTRFHRLQTLLHSHAAALRGTYPILRLPHQSRSKAIRAVPPTEQHCNHPLLGGFRWREPSRCWGERTPVNAARLQG